MCTKRRIKCDRGQPSCKKCIKKGVPCPGYEAQLRWVGGPAIRGRLKDGPSPLVRRSSRHEPDLLPDVQAPAVQSLVGRHFQDLYEYYDKHVAKIMVWVDSEDNLFRRYVLPLARTNLAVRLSIAAVSAQHAAITGGECSISEDARNQAISIITGHISDVTNQMVSGYDTGHGLDLDTAEWILASMLILSSYEMAHSGASAAEFHRKAARSLVNALSTTECRSSIFFVSLRNKLSTYEVFACTTCFDLPSIQDAILPYPEVERVSLSESALFSDYLVLLHEVTLLARQRQNIHGLSRDWKDEFELAKGTSLMIAGRIPISPRQRRDMIRLVDIHHNAALLYVERCFGRESSPDAVTALSDLKRQLLAMDDVDAWIHNMPWPVFIAGVESHDDQEGQQIVSSMYSAIRRVTGLKHYEEVFEFLEFFWSSSGCDWQALARYWEDQGRRILAY